MTTSVLSPEEQRLQRLIDGAEHIVFFGGAGVSTESGIPDFRGTDGLYRQKYQYPPETILHHSFFLSHTGEFFTFYRDKMICTSARPNAAHLKLAELERAGRLDAVITQNIDGLHTAAGSRRVFELHGSVLRNHCMKCGKSYDVETVLRADGVPCCDCGGVIKPDVVLYGEALDDEVVDGAVRALENADLLLIGGTSLNVYPAAGLIRSYRGRELVLINRDPTPADGAATLLLREPIGEVLGRITVKAIS